MAVKITSGCQYGSLTDQRYKITVNGVSIQLEKKDFEELINELGEKLSDDYNRTKDISERYMKEVEAVRLIRNDILKFFYDTYDFDNFAYYAKDLSKLNNDDLFDMLSKHKELLGFE